MQKDRNESFQVMIASYKIYAYTGHHSTAE
jgi:hypothetical protein